MTFSFKVLFLISVASFFLGNLLYRGINWYISTPEERAYDRSGQKYSLNIKFHSFLSGSMFVFVFLYLNTIRISHIAQ